MELSRQEYPALLTLLQPTEAVSVLNERVRLIAKVNADIADWLLERRRIEDAYAQGLKRLVGRRQQDGAASLGVFHTPWQSIVSSTETLADSHAALAQKIEADVEQPLRIFQNKNREMQGISTIQGNLAALAKELDEAQKKSERVLAKGGKAGTQKVSSAISNVQDANQQWNSQAPFVFEQLQALDESRVNHLRDVLTQLQTHEVDQLERSRVSAESCLNVLLNVDTADEVSAFVARNTGGASRMPLQRQSRVASTATPSSPVPPTPSLSGRAPTTPQQPYEAPAMLAPPTPTPSRSVDDGRSVRSATSGAMQPAPAAEKSRKGPMDGLRRLGTVMARRKTDPKPAEQSPSPEKRTRPSRNPLRRGPSSRNMQQIPSPDASTTELPTSPSRQQSSAAREAAQSTPSHADLLPLKPHRPEPDINGDIIEPAAVPRDTPLTNGDHAGPKPSAEPKPRPLSTMPEEAERDSEGFNVPPPAMDDVTRAQQEALAESELPQFKLDIKSEPIREEDGDAKAAMSNVANTLRAQAHVLPPQRKAGTLRGRRDVRNTIFVPNPPTPESQPIPDSGLAPMTPLNMPRAGSVPQDDTRSIRSSHSLSSASQSAVKHPEMHLPGLNASIVETVSAWFMDGQVTKAIVTGEVALAHNVRRNAPQTGAETIRLENFPVLEKVAPNPTFVNQIPSRSGEYTIDPTHLSRTSLAFKYQVHLEESGLSAHVPVMLHPLWKVEPTQISVILSYLFNDAFVSPTKRSVSLQNVVVMINLEQGKALTCLSKPMGHFYKEKSTISWRLGNVTLDAYSDGPRKLLARFSTEGEAKPGSVEARWEISGEDSTVGLGSGLWVSQATVSKEEGADPFADEGIAGGTGGLYTEVPTMRKIMSGKYIAT
ncbi:hypothetical protein MMC13_008447 [Lambiella insularis]|nr:hypothetical protein [Lambiella insularis]